MYLSVSIPSLRTIVDPVADVDTREDRIEAMRVLAAGNTIIMVLLGAVLCLQVSRVSMSTCAPLHPDAHVSWDEWDSGPFFGSP